MLIHTDTHTECTEQCSALYQMPSHTAVMGHAPASHFELFFLLEWKQEGVVRGPGKSFLDLN